MGLGHGSDPSKGLVHAGKAVADLRDTLASGERRDVVKPRGDSVAALTSEGRKDANLPLRPFRPGKSVGLPIIAKREPCRLAAQGARMGGAKPVRLVGLAAEATARGSGKRGSANPEMRSCDMERLEAVASDFRIGF